MLAASKDTWKELDKTIMVCVLLLVTAGMMALFSTAASEESPVLLRDDFSKQVLWFLIGIMVGSACFLMPSKILRNGAYWLYGLSLVLLVLVLFVGGGKGVHRWFILGPVRFQPSEIAKITTILALARYLSDDARDLRRFKDIVVGFAIAILPALLILKEPDLGTAIVLLALILPVFFWAGLSPFLVFLLVSPILVVASAFNIYTFAFIMILISGVLLLTRRKLPVLVLVFAGNVMLGAITPKLWDGLADYQKNRVLTFLGVQDDPRGAGYQVAQSQVAIGSGKFWGKGWTQGTQTKLRFLPEQHTDFIFSVIGEEFGFMGVALVLGAYYVLLWRSLQIAREVKSLFYSIVVIGCAVLIAVHIIVNVGMTVGLMPVTGIPLPFLSYGGSSMMLNMSLIGLILGAAGHRLQH